MNERIKQLAEQANLTEVIDDAYQERNDWQPFVEKFAELIVKECEVALKPPVQVRDVISRGQAYDLIKQHFGVEERKGWVCPKCGVDRTKDVCPKGHFATMTGDCPMTATVQTGVEL